MTENNDSHTIIDDVEFQIAAWQRDRWLDKLSVIMGNIKKWKNG